MHRHDYGTIERGYAYCEVDGCSKRKRVSDKQAVSMIWGPGRRWRRPRLATLGIVATVVLVNLSRTGWLEGFASGVAFCAVVMEVFVSPWAQRRRELRGGINPLVGVAAHDAKSGEPVKILLTGEASKPPYPPL